MTFWIRNSTQTTFLIKCQDWKKNLLFPFNIWQSNRSNRVVEGSILLGCDASWLGNWLPTFRCAPWNVLNQLPSDAASLPRRQILLQLGFWPVHLHSFSTVFLKLDSAEPQDSGKDCQRFRHTKIHNGGTVLFAVLYFYVRIKVCVATFDTNYSVIYSMQAINRCFNPEASWFCSEVSYQRSSQTVLMCQAKRPSYRLVWG
jgi:hypothetical protein